MKNEKNRKLTEAKKSKKDEFYTQLEDIEQELKHYKKHFKNKVVYCNCDDPRVSNFFKYFSLNFEKLGLKKLITTCYQNQNMDLFSQHKSKKAIYLVYEGDKNGNQIPDPEEIGIQNLKGDGDFRSEEAIELLKESDIVVTNPPFSLFRPYVAQLFEHKKKFLIIGHQNQIKYKETFKLIKENKMWMGHGFKGNVAHFINNHYEDYAAAGDHKEGMIRVSGVTWLTNLDHSKRHEDLILYKKFNKDEYLRYDNYDAINVDKTKEIPMDYKGIMGVPITFMYKYNPDQFEIMGMTSGRNEFEAVPTKKYKDPIQINSDGTKINGSKANTSAAILWKKKPDGVYYTASKIKGFLTILYTRFLIKNSVDNVKIFSLINYNLFLVFCFLLAISWM